MVKEISREEFEELKDDFETLKDNYNKLLEFLDNSNLKQKIDFYQLEVSNSENLSETEDVDEEEDLNL